VDLPRAGGRGMHKRLRQRAAEMARELLPRLLRHVADGRGIGGRHRLLRSSRAAVQGVQGPPKTGSLGGIGGSSQAPVAGGLMSASTCTSISAGRPEAMAASSVPAKSSDRVTVWAVTPAARAQAAKSGL